MKIHLIKDGDVSNETFTEVFDLLNALDEVRKAWLPPLSTDPKEVQENKLKEINYFINLSHVITEAVNIAS